MYYCLILYSYTHCTFQQIYVQAICSKQHNICYFQQITIFSQFFKPFSNNHPTLKVNINSARITPSHKHKKL